MTPSFSSMLPMTEGSLFLGLAASTPQVCQMLGKPAGPLDMAAGPGGSLFLFKRTAVLLASEAWASLEPTDLPLLIAGSSDLRYCTSLSGQSVEDESRLLLRVAAGLWLLHQGCGQEEARP